MKQNDTNCQLDVLYSLLRVMSLLKGSFHLSELNYSASSNYMWNWRDTGVFRYDHICTVIQHQDSTDQECNRIRMIFILFFYRKDLFKDTNNYGDIPNLCISLGLERHVLVLLFHRHASYNNNLLSSVCNYLCSGI